MVYWAFEQLPNIKGFCVTVLLSSAISLCRDGTEMDCKNITSAVEHQVVGPELDIENSSFPKELVLFTIKHAVALC